MHREMNNAGSPLAPGQRIVTLDVLRGFALMGILVVNIQSFAGLLMGLLQPTSGQIQIDQIELDEQTRLGWQQHIAHVPQSIFLLDGSFIENIAFGVPENQIDLERVKRAAELAQIAGFIEGTQAGYQGVVGERGVRLSGGQRQRIGIARALYRKSSVLVLDEATSALDSETESAVIESILDHNPDLTILMIAHRVSTLERCDLMVNVDSGQVTISQRSLT